MNTRKGLISLLICMVVGMASVVLITPVHAKKLIIGVGQEPASMDPSMNFKGPDFVVTDNFIEYLIERAPNGKLVPGLAASWKVSPDGKEVTFALREGVKFHSGDLMTTKDVVFSFERGKAKNPVTRIRLRSMDRLEVIDDYHFKVYFKSPDVTFIPNRACAPIVSKSYYDRVGEDAFVKHPVGTSPYKLVRHAIGEYVDIERFEDYWGEKPPVKEARFYFVPEGTTRVAKLKAGEVDLINSCPYPMIKDIEKTPGLKLIRYETNHPSSSVLFHNLNPNTPWYDKRVRKAMAYAIDWRGIIKNMLQGFPNHWAFLSKGEVGYDPDLKSYPYDPKKAKALLAEAGYPKGFDFKLYWEVTGRYPMARETAEAVAAYFGAVGIRTKLVGEESVAHTARFRATKKKTEAKLVACRTMGRAVDPSYYIALAFGTNGPFSVYSNPEVDKLLAEARATMDDTKRGELIRKVVRILHEDVARIPIFDVVSFYAVKNNINFTPTKGILHDLILVKDVIIQ